MTFELVVGWVAALIAAGLAAKATRELARPGSVDDAGFRNPGFRVLVYLISFGLPLYYPVIDDRLQWAHLVVLVGAGVGFFSTRFTRRAPAEDSNS